ncbi:hypothetical protein BDD12DRAFT_886491 [Trichophaea hybrida]|nr:hypothetical protein BDD12DRAFT_886491 [Trichophaea hybrida]
MSENVKGIARTSILASDSSRSQTHHLAMERRRSDPGADSNKQPLLNNRKVSQSRAISMEGWQSLTYTPGHEDDARINYRGDKVRLIVEKVKICFPESDPTSTPTPLHPHSSVPSPSGGNGS